MKNPFPLILSKVSLLDVAKRYGAMRRSGSYLVMRCPWADEDMRFWKGSDGYWRFTTNKSKVTGNVISFLAKVKGIKVGFAVQELLNECGPLRLKKEQPVPEKPPAWWIYQEAQGPKALQLYKDGMSIEDIAKVVKLRPMVVSGLLARMMY